MLHKAPRHLSTHVFPRTASGAAPAPLVSVPEAAATVAAGGGGGGGSGKDRAEKGLELSGMIALTGLGASGGCETRDRVLKKVLPGTTDDAHEIVVVVVVEVKVPAPMVVYGSSSGTRVKAVRKAEPFGAAAAVLTETNPSAHPRRSMLMRSRVDDGDDDNNESDGSR